MLENPYTFSDNLEELPIVCIDWYDAVCSGGPHWQSFDDIEEAITNGPSKVRTVGMVLKQTDDYIAICDTIILDGESGGYVHVIPSGMIITLKVLQ
tara:strand:+ start:1994 stop:2281 length:288 start_codon:yes stop_codon:yes gene_type:complete